jgi:hypothetical protein
MNLFDWLKWRAEHKAKLAKEKEIKKEKDKHEAEIQEKVTLIGEIEGLKQKILTYQESSRNLMFSPHVQIGKFQEKLAIKIARLEYLKNK